MALVAEGKNKSLGAKSVILHLNTEGSFLNWDYSRIGFRIILGFKIVSQNKKAERDFVAFGFSICQSNWISIFLLAMSILSQFTLSELGIHS